MRTLMLAAALGLSGCLSLEELRERDPTGYWEVKLEGYYGHCRRGPCGATLVMSQFDERDVSELREVLRKQDPFFARAAARLLAEGTGDRTAALPELRGLIESPDCLIATSALAALGSMGEPAVPHLLWALREGEPGLRSFAASCLGGIGPGAAEALPDLVWLAAECPSEERRPSDPLRAGFLLRRRPERVSALSALGQIGKPAEGAVPVLILLLDDPDLGIEAAETLCKLGAAAAAVPFLEACLTDPGPVSEQTVRSAVLVARHHGGSPDLFQLLLLALEHRSPRLRLETLYALKYLRLEGPLHPELLAAVARRLGDRYPEVRNKSLWILRKLGPHARPALPAVCEALADPDEDVQLEAAEALEAIDPVEISALAPDGAPILGYDASPAVSSSR